MPVSRDGRGIVERLREMAHPERRGFKTHLEIDFLLREAADHIEALEARPAAPMQHDQFSDDYLFTDEHGDVWRLTRTGDPSLPLTIEIIARANAAAPGEEPR